MFEYFNVEYSEKYRIKLKLLKTLTVIVDHDSKKKKSLIFSYFDKLWRHLVVISNNKCATTNKGQNYFHIIWLIQILSQFGKTNPNCIKSVEV